MRLYSLGSVYMNLNFKIGLKMLVKLTKEQIQKIVELYKSGVSVNEIHNLYESEGLPISKRRIRDILKYKEINSNKVKTEFTKELIDICVKEYNDGFSTGQIANKLKVRSFVISRLLKENGIEIRSKQQRSDGLKTDLLGRAFGRWIVIAPHESINGRVHWKCKCSCGNENIVSRNSLTSGDSKSCGCLNDEKRSERAPEMYSRATKYTPIEASARRVWKNSYVDSGNLSYEDFYKLSQLNCYYCNASPANMSNRARENTSHSQFAKDNGFFIYNGLDRIDNTKPHEVDNCVPCCYDCNYAKRDRSVDQFKKWIIELATNFCNMTNKDIEK